MISLRKRLATPIFGDLAVSEIDHVFEWPLPDIPAETVGDAYFW